MSNINKSYSYKIFKVLFLTNKPLVSGESKAIKFFNKIYFPYATEALLIVALLLFWYEGLLVKYLPIVDQVWLAPALIILALLLADKNRIKIYKFHFWYLVFLLLALVSGLIAISSGLDGRMVFIGWFIFVQFGLALVAVQSIRNASLFLKSITVFALPLALVGIYQSVVSVPTSALWLSPGEDLTRAFSFFGSPNVFGMIMVTVTLLSLGLCPKEKKKYWLVPSALFGLALILTYSRSAWLALAFGIIYFLLIYRHKTVFYLPLALLFLLIPQIRNRLGIVFSKGYLNDSFLDGRLWSLQNGLYIFKKYPFLGTGPGSYGGKTAVSHASPVYLESVQEGYTALYYTDNQPLEVLIQTGVFGFISFIGFFLSLISELTKKALKKDIMSLVAGSAVIVFIVGGLFANVLEFSAISVTVALVTGVSFSES